MRPQRLFLPVIIIVGLGAGLMRAEPPKPAESPEPAETPIEKFRGIKILPKAQTVTVAGRICLDQGLLELLACTPSGKTHESLLVLDCEPKDLNVALMIIGLSKGPSKPYEAGETVELDGDPVTLHVSWVKDGVTVRQRAEDLVWDNAKNQTMPQAGWIYVGSKFVKLPYYEEVNGELVYQGEREYYLAQQTGNLIATYHDPGCILDTPLATGGDDTVYYVHAEVVPPRGTPITLEIARGPAKDAQPRPPADPAPKDE